MSHGQKLVVSGFGVADRRSPGIIPIRQPPMCHGWPWVEGGNWGGQRDAPTVGSSPGDRPASQHIQKQFILKLNRFCGKHKTDLSPSVVLGKSFAHHLSEGLKRQGSEDVVLKAHRKGSREVRLSPDLL